MSTSLPFHARPEVRTVLGEALRPGGLELTSRLLDLAGLAPAARVLDLGCGPGASLRDLQARGFRAVGVDAALQTAEAAGACVLGRAAALPFAEGAFDAVLCECAASCMGAGQEIFAEVRRVLRPGGRLLLSDMYSRVPRNGDGGRCGSCHEGALTLEGWRKVFRQAGFDVAVLEDHSRKLAELTARLVFANALSWRHGIDCAPPGYFLCIATREG